MVLKRFGQECAETHGISGSHVVLVTESQDAYDAIREDTIREDTIREDTIREDTIREDTIREDTIREDTISHYWPVGEEELELVTDRIECRWRLHRLITMERSAPDSAIAAQTDGSPTARASNALFTPAGNSFGLALLQRLSAL